MIPISASSHTRHGDRLAGKTAVVTGIGNGIGKGVALMFARQGARVVGCDLDAAAAQATVDTARIEDLRITSVTPCDLLHAHHVEALMSEAARDDGVIDIVVNAAATATFRWIEDMTLDDWHHTLAGELDIVFLACKAAWPYLKRRGGSIINFASVNAYMALQGSAALAHCAGKGGVLAMTRQLAMEGAPHGIRANTISPGLIVTAATSAVLETAGFLENVMAKKMIKRLGHPEDIAWCATYLASDESGWVTASDFSVDGGASAW